MLAHPAGAFNFEPPPPGRALYLEPCAKRVRVMVGGEVIARAWIDLARRVADYELYERPVSGRPGLVVEQGGVVVTVYSFEIVDDRIKHIWAVRNPDKLRPWLR